MNDLKKEFLSYLRSVYGGESQVVSAGLPPLRVSGIYPTFRRDQDAFSMLGGLPMVGQGMGQPMGMGMGQPMGMGSMMGMGAQPMMGLQQPMPEQGMGMLGPGGF